MPASSAGDEPGAGSPRLGRVAALGAAKAARPVELLAIAPALTTVSERRLQITLVPRVMGRLCRSRLVCHAPAPTSKLPAFLVLRTHCPGHHPSSLHPTGRDSRPPPPTMQPVCPNWSPTDTPWTAQIAHTFPTIIPSSPALEPARQCIVTGHRPVNVQKEHIMIASVHYCSYH